MTFREYLMEPVERRIGDEVTTETRANNLLARTAAGVFLGLLGACLAPIAVLAAPLALWEYANRRKEPPVPSSEGSAEA